MSNTTREKDWGVNPAFEKHAYEPRPWKARVRKRVPSDGAPGFEPQETK
jgi:hypothetical protein